MISFSLLALLAVIFFAPPGEDSGFYPPCLFHKTTGLYCPSCGSTRAVHHFLHGRLAKSLSSNPLATLAFPLFLIFLVLMIRFALTGKSIKHPRLKWSHLWYALIPFFLFWILRNLPFYPFTLLIPTK